MVSPTRKRGGNPPVKWNNILRIPAQQPGKPQPVPKHLEPEEATLWRSITAEYQLDDDAALMLLSTALECRGRLRRIRLVIDREGESVRDRWGQSKPHPLLPAERGARDSFAKLMRALNLDTAGPDR